MPALDLANVAVLFPEIVAVVSMGNGPDTKRFLGELFWVFIWQDLAPDEVKLSKQQKIKFFQ